MLTRYSASFGFGAVVTSALLFLMQQMIATGRGALTDPPSFRLAPFYRVDSAPEPPASNRRKPERPQDREPPPRPETPSAGDGSPTVSIRIDGPGTPRLNPGTLRRGRMIDGDLVALAKVLPVYPAAASRAGLEGYVVVEFTVTRNGTVTDVRVVESTDRVFERAAVQAAAKFRYRPRVIDGEAVEIRGVQNKLTFDLED